MNNQINTETRTCLKCGHEERHSDNEGGICEKITGPAAYGEPFDSYCGCECLFAMAFDTATKRLRG